MPERINFDDLPDGFFHIGDASAYRELIEQVPENGIIAEIGGIFR